MYVQRVDTPKREGVITLKFCLNLRSPRRKGNNIPQSLPLIDPYEYWLLTIDDDDDEWKYWHDHVQEAVSTGELRLLQKGDLVETLAANESEDDNFPFLQMYADRSIEQQA
ncbi:hypothetical protein CAPTEDRAFT_185121 [Capitella teleta]|uniref:Uncharacterized protein n=1 Tax=Capitella teleta TaxID=283909 RepID=R7UEH0_CAPTE|nr:hypothetical protein CAPTEDRAFT_185121 [Capitella teleta]|eukprot:ELU02188.1 hypothetical protein CAPTEDRAFT_185121 [Capitella teleta]